MTSRREEKKEQSDEVGQRVKVTQQGQESVGASSK